MPGHVEAVAVKTEIPIRIVLVDPPDGVDFGVQHGRGSKFEARFVQQRARGDIRFDFSLGLAVRQKGKPPNFVGPFAQGPASGRFVYVDVGTYAGQQGTQWSRRMKIPLGGITWPIISKVLSRPDSTLVARIPGTGKDGGPNCATVRLLGDWQIS